MIQVHTKTAALLLAAIVIGGAGLYTSPVAATTNADHANDISCEQNSGVDVAVIEFSDVPTWKLWIDAYWYADASIEKCDLESRQVKELAGEVRAHAIGYYHPGDPTGPTIDMGEESIDPQADRYAYLMDTNKPLWWWVFNGPDINLGSSLN